MNFLVQTIIGTQSQLRSTGKLAQQELDQVNLQWFEADRKILRTHTSQGREIGFRLLKEGLRLHHDDVVFLDGQLAILVNIVPSEVMVLSPKTLPEMARVCYEIGNKHTPLFLDGDELLLPYDKPLFEWLQAAGFAPVCQQRRLNEQLRANSATGVGVAHSHEHSHPHHH